jgi:ribulose-5-phosphate 4-epimerase/fuculose-1-phosphate aldolase
MLTSTYPSPEEWEIVRICGEQMDAKSASRCWRNHGFFAYSY